MATHKLVLVRHGESEWNKLNLFTGWTDVPDTMPAHDITIYGTYTTGIDAILAGKNSNAKIFTIDGKQLEKPQKGVNIVPMSDGTVKKIVVK